MNIVYYYLISKVSMFKWMFKCEYWENCGGFLYVFFIVGGILLLMSLFGILFGLFVLYCVVKSGGLLVDNKNVSINGFDLGMLIGQFDVKDMVDLVNVFDLILFFSFGWLFVVFIFVVFFYCLGVLYDDCCDCSILFWKLLLLFDIQIVLVKVISVLVIVLLIVVVVVVVMMFGFLVIILVVVLVYGGDLMMLIWGLVSLLLIIFGYIVCLLVYLLWVLLIVGWLLMCLVWVKFKLFLWVVMLLLFVGIVVSSINLMFVFGLISGWFWGYIVGCLLLGIFFGVDVVYNVLGWIIGFEQLVSMLLFVQYLFMLQQFEVWIGVVVGIVFLIIVICLCCCVGEI